MSLAVAVLKEQAEGERRVALDPASANELVNKGFQVLVETGAGNAAGFSDKQYSACTLLDDAEIILTMADIWLWVQAPATEHLANLPDGQVCMGLVFADRNPAVVDTLIQHRHTCIAMERVPSISRTQSINVLSSQATISGYQAALKAATLAPRLFPMLTTAAGILRPARVIVIGTGVAGLQAIATAKRLGAQVEAWDLDSSSREKVESLGATLINVENDSDKIASDNGSLEGESPEGDENDASVDDSIASEQTEDQKAEDQTRKPEEILADHLSRADAVIATLSNPTGPAAIIITAEMVEGMSRGSVIIDMAADSGGNCELTEPGTTVIHNGVTIDGPLNLASEAATHASQMYAHNLLEMLDVLVEDDTIIIDRDDEVINGTLLTYEGKLACEDTANSLSPDTTNDPQKD